MHTYRYAISETVLLALGRPNVSWRAEYKVVGYIWPGDQEVRYVIRSTSRASASPPSTRSAPHIEGSCR